MHGLSTEYHALKDKTMAGIAVNIAEHLARHQPYGRAAVVTGDPQGFWVELQKAWHALAQELERAGQTNELAYVRSCTFTTAPPVQESYEHVQIATVEDFLAWPPQSATMYITGPIKRDQLHKITSWMPRYGVVVFYGKAVG